MGILYRLNFFPGALLLGLAPLLGACNSNDGADHGSAPSPQARTSVAPLSADGSVGLDERAPAPAPTQLALATFAGGCFWCMESPYEKLDGVSAAIAGYTGGHVEDPTYAQVCGGRTGHTEAIQIQFDPGRIRYEDLLDVFWRQIDPTDPGGQFVDRGDQYRSEIFYHDEVQRLAALASREALEASGRFGDPIVTAITEAPVFYPAEARHQDFYCTNPGRYESYRRGSGRDRFLDAAWGAEREYHPEPLEVEPRYSRPSDAELRELLTPLQYRVTQEEGTEPPFQNTYWDHHGAGIYVDVVSGEPLFSSRDKFESGSGWPSFTRPLVSENVVTGLDLRLGVPRDELRSAHADSHLGHVFGDGPAPTGKRYCINSAALRFVPVEELEEQGYGEFLPYFD